MIPPPLPLTDYSIRKKKKANPVYESDGDMSRFRYVQIHT